MTPVAMPTSSSAMPQGPATVSRPGSPAMKAGPAQGAPRPQAAARADAAAGGQTSRGGSGFASVLAAVREDDDRARGVPEETPAADTLLRALPPDTESPGARAAETTDHQVIVLPDDIPAAPAPTPWLWLAFGSGTIARSGNEESTGADSLAPSTEVPVPPSGVPAASAARPDPMAVAPDATTSVAEPTQAAIAPQATPGASASLDMSMNGAEVPGGKRRLPADAPASGRPGTEVEGVWGARWTGGHADVAVGQAMPPTNAIPSGDAAASADVMSADDLKGVSATLPGETLERWRAAPPGAAREPRAEPVDAPDAQTASVAGWSPAPGREVSRLAHWVRTAGSAGEPMGPVVPRSLVTETLTTLPSAGHATARATEVLWRFAQSSGEVSPTRPPGDGAVPLAPVGTAAPIGPALSDVSAPVTAAPVPPAAGDQVLHQVVSSLKMQWKDGIGEAKLHLRPDALGAVSVSLRVEAGAVTAVVRAESPQVQEWVVQHQHTLRQQMEAAGLHLDDLVVTPDDQRHGDPQQETPPEPRRRRQPAEQTTDAAAFDQLL